MTTAIQNTFTRIDQDWLDKNRNEKADKSLAGHFIDYTGKAIGAFRSLQVIRGVCKLWNEVAPSPSPIAKSAEGSIGVAMASLGVVRLSSATKEAVERVVDLTQDTGVAPERKASLAIKDVGDAIATWIYSAIFLTGKATFLRVAQFADLASDGADLAISAEDYYKALQHEEASTGEVKEAFAHTKRYNMLRTLKAVVAVVSSLFAVLMFMAGVQFVSVAAMILLSVTAASLAIRRDIYKEQGRYSVISFERAVTV